MFLSYCSMLAIVITMNIASTLLVQEKTQRLLLLALSVFVVTVVLLLSFIETKNLSIAFQVFDNLLLIATGIYLIHKGISKGESHYFFFGMVTILLTALIRYFDLIGDYIGGALLFGFFAIVLIVSAKFFWRQQSKNKEAS